MRKDIYKLSEKLGLDKKELLDFIITNLNNVEVINIYSKLKEKYIIKVLKGHFCTMAVEATEEPDEFTIGDKVVEVVSFEDAVRNELVFTSGNDNNKVEWLITLLVTMKNNVHTNVGAYVYIKDDLYYREL